VPAVLAAVAAMGIALAACGSGSSTSTTSAGTGRAEFVAAANRICKQESRQLSRYPIKSTAELLSNGPKQIVTERAAAKQLTALKPPTQLRTDWHVFLTGIDQANADYRRLVAEVRLHHYRAAQTTSTAGHAAVLRAHVAAARNGIADCSKV
jgi:hypothetical protein